MATRRQPLAKDPKPAELNAEAVDRGIVLLTRRLAEVQSLDPTKVVNQFEIPEFERVAASIDDALVRTFGNNTIEYNRYKDASHFNNGPFNYAYPVPIRQVHESLARSKASSLALLEQAVQSLRERQDEFNGAPPEPHDEAKKAYDAVFVVHGRDEGAREAVARFLEKIGLKAIILHEQPNRGRTIIEKIEEYSNVDFAVVILTPDDEGNLKGEPSQLRARQNVLLELGYFVGKLGRENVCVLKAGDIELPSDWQGVVNGTIDAGGGWKTTLAKELAAAGYAIDWNRVMA